MQYCTTCGHGLVEPVQFCTHCGASCGKDFAAPAPVRPRGVTVLAVLTLIYSAIALIGVFGSSPTFFFGQFIYGGAAQIFSAVNVAIGVYCGIGLLNLQNAARVVYIASSLVNTLNSLLSLALMDDLIRSFGIHGGGDAALVGGIIGFIVGLAINVVIITYLIRQRPAFVR